MAQGQLFIKEIVRLDDLDLPLVRSAVNLDDMESHRCRTERGVIILSQHHVSGAFGIAGGKRQRRTDRQRFQGSAGGVVQARHFAGPVGVCGKATYPLLVIFAHDVGEQERFSGSHINGKALENQLFCGRVIGQPGTEAIGEIGKPGFSTTGFGVHTGGSDIHRDGSFIVGGE